MNCPVCKINMHKYPVAGFELDFCKKCEGIWFDKGEFRPIVNSLLSTDIITSRLGKYQSLTKEPQSRNLTCPKCKALLNIVNYSFDSNVFVDKCPSCHGLWTDKGELLDIAEYIKGGERIAEHAEGIAELFKKKEVWGVKFLGKYQYVISVAIGILYLLLAYLSGDSQTAMADTFKFLTIPLFLIWFGGPLGKITMRIWIRPAIYRATPGFVVKLLGWVILLMPIPVGILFMIIDRS